VCESDLETKAIKPKHLRFLRLKTSAEVFYSSPYTDPLAFWCAECARHLHQSIFPLSGCAISDSETLPIFVVSKIPSIFVHPPRPLWTLWCAESTCQPHLSIAPLVAAILTKSAHFWTTYHHRFEQFDALNRAVISVCPYLLWSLHYLNEGRRRFSKILSIFVSPLPPLWTVLCAKSHCHLHLSIVRLVVALQWKVGADFFRVFLSTTALPLYNSLMRWIRLRYPFVDSCFGCWVTIINIQLGRKIPANIFIHQ